jgi:homoserine dehydrogenase
VNVSRVNIGLLGCGVVGTGVLHALAQSADRIAVQSGIRFRVTRIAVQHRDLQRDSIVPARNVCTDWSLVCEDPDIDIVVEVMGGLTPAYEAISRALELGKHVVTANKELLAKHGAELLVKARRYGRTLLFEASVLGGIPALHALTTYFSANRIHRIRGIVNGTGNYILTQMEQSGTSFSDALREAQTLGYAEADPSLDINGLDALYKLQVLARQVWGVGVNLADADCEGIAGVHPDDVQIAASLGCRLKHVAEAIWDGPENPLQFSVRPMFIPEQDALYGIHGVTNVLSVYGDLVGEVVLSGPGAGAMPTASAVVEDLVKVARGTVQALSLATVCQLSPVLHDTYLIRRLLQRRTVLEPFQREVNLLFKPQKLQVIHDDHLVQAVLIHHPLGNTGELMALLKQGFDGDIAIYPVIGEHSTAVATSQMTAEKVLN